MSTPLILDPTVIPVLESTLQGAAVPSDRLTASGLRAHFANPPSWQPEMAGDRPDRPEGALRAASVLVPLVQREHGLSVLLTQRTAHLADHAGQISFPGGRAEPHDADEVATALRETVEEIGLAAHHVEVVGRLPHYVTITRYQVTPVVALVHPPFELAPDPFEVAEAFEVPLSFLMDPANHQRRGGDMPKVGRRGFLAMPYRAPHRPEHEYFIWGATAAMLRNLYCFLAAEPQFA